MAKDRVRHGTDSGAETLGWHYPEILSYKDFNKGDSVDWIDEDTKSQFMRPVFGYGEGPFKIIKIRTYSKKSDSASASDILFQISTPKGEALLSSEHFKKT